MNILVLCTGNSCRSQIAEGYIRHFANGHCNVFSAGIETHGLNPLAVKVMAEDGVDISKHRSTSIDAYDGIAFEYIITVCDHARESCPWLKAKILNLHYSFPDPAKATGTPEEILQEFRIVRDEIKIYCEHFAKKYVTG
ncbi:MAG: arsenate reductase ArsC [Saprospiraceae bacterium]|nr:arsenate reductase ArsC [Saprospiraceae bacterium]MBK8450866.1 arsenate reductase ArsC [Saprospiraceae bacterium]MBK9223142.1 arsenate reductase ArsC [Saprospiraceae bacterium]MBK9720672.1 arsenate reductase ArsC [Saprospiraceae bacterium]MBK9727661.1 arsenate reductase ArsC [Saprospiraceae bacterium]